MALINYLYKYLSICLWIFTQYAFTATLVKYEFYSVFFPPGDNGKGNEVNADRCQLSWMFNT